MSRLKIFFRCPYCHGGRGDVALDTEACAALREDHPTFLSLEGRHFRDGQLAIVFGAQRPHQLPCKHVLHMEGDVVWRPYIGDEDSGDEASTWCLNFHWICDRLLKPDCHHTGQLTNHYRTLGEAVRGFMPRVPFEWTPFTLTLSDDSASWLARTGRASTYEVHARFLVAARPEQFVEELKDKARQYNLWLMRNRR